MTDYIPTTEELKGKPVRELNAIFRQAAIAAIGGTTPARRAAQKTMENVRRARPRPCHPD